MRRSLVAFALALIVLSSPALMRAGTDPIQPLRFTGTGAVFCTAFSINEAKGYWMTAAHCTQDDDGKPYTFTIGDSGEAVKLVAVFSDVDIAIVSSDIKAEGFKLATETPARGDYVTVVGFGYGFVPATTFWGRVSNTIQIEGRRYLLFDMRVWPGHSGSPIRNAKGEVVSVAQISAAGTAGGVTFDDLSRRATKYFPPVEVK